MFSPEQLNEIMAQALTQLTGGEAVPSGTPGNNPNGNSGGNGNNGGGSGNTGGTGGNAGGGTSSSSGLNFSPAKALVITGLLTDALNVNSILVGNDQHIEIVLVGELKRKTELDKMMDKVGKLPFDDVMKAFLDHFASP